MPELPDVEGFRRVLAEHATRRRVRDVHVHDAQVLRGTTARRLRDTLTGARLAEPHRHGKWLLAPVSGGPVLLFHFGMTGSLEWNEPHRHDRVVLEFARGTLHYRDMRKLKGIHLAADSDAADELLAGLGPDAAGLTAARLRGIVSPLRRQVKPALADQAVVAGLGNLLVDEVLWRARVHPRRRASTLDRDEHTRLHRGLRAVLRRSTAAGRVPDHPSWLTGRRDDPHGHCPRCGTLLRRGRVGGRGTVWCPDCQR
ncbi:Fpg/Nei family DNA glycosylase [Amycolatopsis suaedae]|uniref:Fpg/Nei family DNA glycosylase n=1 Tax=Amycolatopsis suaedae TaxID=2510978 RepID=A0A4Q7IX15_9PSEU|nr:DNA-formamidopyrimidine glycosylase family protein [Amycolatopsis suaedae]RZQ59481.1 Fpg/Nei family DNA glycosylase [Amycolatopsis suaedae]